MGKDVNPVKKIQGQLSWFRKTGSENEVRRQKKERKKHPLDFDYGDGSDMDEK